MRLSIVFHHCRHYVVELETFLPAIPVTHELGLVPSSRMACRTWNEAHLLVAFVSVPLRVVQLARLKFQRVSRLFPHHCLSLFLRPRHLCSPVLFTHRCYCHRQRLTAKFHLSLQWLPGKHGKWKPPALRRAPVFTVRELPTPCWRECPLSIRALYEELEGGGLGNAQDLTVNSPASCHRKSPSTGFDLALTVQPWEHWLFQGWLFQWWLFQGWLFERVVVPRVAVQRVVVQRWLFQG